MAGQEQRDEGRQPPGGARTAPPSRPPSGQRKVNPGNGFWCSVRGRAWTGVVRAAPVWCGDGV